jgi:hypothetical protein
MTIIIGVQQILPRSGTGGQGANPTPDQHNDAGGTTSPATPDGPPAAPGTGQIVDIKA